MVPAIVSISTVIGIILVVGGLIFILYTKFKMGGVGGGEKTVLVQIITTVVGIVLIIGGIAIILYFPADPMDAPNGITCWWPGDGNTNEIGGCGFQGNQYNYSSGANRYGDGKVDKAFYFDGDDDYISFGNVPSSEGSNGTYELWFWAEDIYGTPNLLIKGNTSAQMARRIALIPDGTGGNTACLQFSISLDANNDGDYEYYQINTPSGASDEPNIVPRTWYHVATTWGNDGMHIYLDGKHITENGYTGFGNATNQPLFIGNWGTQTQGSFGFHGLIDEVSIYNRALTENEIKAIYDSGSRGKMKN